MKNLPENVEKYHQSDLFTQETVPDTLLQNHDIKENTWGLICVQSGKLEYTILDENKSYTLTTETKGVVEPEVKHKIKPLGDVSFYIEFYK